MPSIQIKAPAKINLSLDVLRRREDNYHELEMIMHTVDLYDLICITAEKSENTHIEIVCNAAFVPTDNSNLCYKAAKLFLEKSEINARIKIEIDKNIPVGAGLGGGSSDAAATLLGLSKLFEYPLAQEALLTLGKEVGADVPFFIYGGCMLARGIGEILSPLPRLENANILIAKPDFGISTAFVYKKLVLDETTPHPNTPEAIKALNTGDLHSLGKHAKNVLETVVSKLHPEIEEYKTIMANHNAVYSLMSGSGSAVFGVFKGQEDASKAAQVLRQKTKQVFLV